VDKVIIAQESLGEFINNVSPGAYKSMTKVNFTDLDRTIIRPIGVYGSKSEIVRLLKDLNAVDDKTYVSPPIIYHLDAYLCSSRAELLLRPQEVAAEVGEPCLRSGIYVLNGWCDPAEFPEKVYVIYWPETTTWDDNATSTVSRNRVTFLR
jgi:hypothetical protein